MTAKEFSDQFDVLYNNITSNLAPGLNEYEKSVFLTKALDEVVKNHFSPNSKGNTLELGFDQSLKRLVDFSALVRTLTLSPVTADTNIHFADNEKYYAMPLDIFVYINEILEVNRNGHSCLLTIVPLAFDEYHRLMSKPFKRPLKYLAWRLITGGSSNLYTYTDYTRAAYAIREVLTSLTIGDIINTILDKNLDLVLANSGYALKIGADKYLADDGTLVGSTANAKIFTSAQKNSINTYINILVSPSAKVVEVIPGPHDVILNYTVRYLTHPTPIILIDLSNEGVSLRGQTGPMECLLDPILHEEILLRAVELAKASWASEQELIAAVNMITTTGQRSE